MFVQQTGDVASEIKVYGVKRQLYRRVTSLLQDQTACPFQRPWFDQEDKDKSPGIKAYNNNNNNFIDLKSKH